jgi:hypothetical protein
MRAKLKIHSSNPSCWACHVHMDPVGLAFEAYDDVGRFRTTDVDKKPVDATGTLTGAGSQDGAFNGIVELGKKLSASEVVHQCFLRHAFRAFMGRHEEERDGCSMRAVYDGYRKADGDLAEMLVALFTSPSFLNRNVK